MGLELGPRFDRLLGEVIELRELYQFGLTLFATKRSRVELLNACCGHTFALLQRELMFSLVSRVSRLSDPCTTMGQTNLSMRVLQDFAPVRDQTGILDVAIKAAEPIRNFRRKRVAHLDRAAALVADDQNVWAPSQHEFSAFIEASEQIVAQVHNHYFESELDLGEPDDFGLELLHTIRGGLEFEKMLRRGERAPVGPVDI